MKWQSNNCFFLKSADTSIEVQLAQTNLSGNSILRETDTFDAYITHVSVVVRSDKRHDRVEVAPEQLHEAFLKAEDIEKRTQKRTRVVGWYHSHPHITVFPSSVDLRTQAGQQRLDPRFFGLILSCFDTNAQMAQTIQLTCFQTLVDSNQSQSHKHVSLSITPAPPTRESLNSKFEIINQIQREAHTLLHQNMGPIPTRQDEILHYNLGALEATSAYNNQIWNLTCLHVYPAIESAKSVCCSKRSREKSQASYASLLNAETSALSSKDDVLLKPEPPSDLIQW
ncbi:hypothetical protein DSO57_1020980 [Entomophthora muscae]|uniref:Uncharacterized protein n=1 Tax=Entomophthora muscae TaxID=34485 RepID=A0ACC2UPB4_9FUNG|nr:hypothetical protein DSO57_1020980 [Entomophthora muscae]